METKPLLYGLIGFFLGGLIVAIAANTFDKPELQDGSSMDRMASSLERKKGEDFDKEFLSSMIEHHESAVDMARLAESHAQHNEVKQLSRDIIAAQDKEILELKTWQKNWGYNTSGSMSRDGTQMSH